MIAALFLSMFVLVPAALLALIRPVGRWAFFVLGLVFAFGIGFFVELRGADNSNGVLQIVGLGVAAGALLVEAIAFPLRRRRCRREAEAGGGDRD
jgi:drug/metabolite transporter (DMT)-like permease